MSFDILEAATAAELYVSLGVLLTYDPTFNSCEDTVTIGQIKARLFY